MISKTVSTRKKNQQESEYQEEASAIAVAGRRISKTVSTRKKNQQESVPGRRISKSRYQEEESAGQ